MSKVCTHTVCECSHAWCHLCEADELRLIIKDVEEKSAAFEKQVDRLCDEQRRSFLQGVEHGRAEVVQVMYIKAREMQNLMKYDSELEIRRLIEEVLEEKDYK